MSFKYGDNGAYFQTGSRGVCSQCCPLAPFSPPHSWPITESGCYWFLRKMALYRNPPTTTTSPTPSIRQVFGFSKLSLLKLLMKAHSSFYPIKTIFNILEKTFFSPGVTS